MSGCSRRRSSSRRRRWAVPARACSCPTPSRASARGCIGSTASRRSSNARKEIDERDQENHPQGIEGIHGRGTSRDEGARGGAEGCPRRQGGRGKRRAREDRRNARKGSRHGRAAPCHRQGQRTGPLAENLVRDARICQGRQGRLLLQECAQVQDEVRDVRLQRQGEPRRRRHVADRLRPEGVDRSRRGQDLRAREASRELRTERRPMNDTTVTTPNELEIRVERVFDAPRPHVFSVWTDPQLIPEWWGDGTVVEEMDVRAGGTYRFRTAFGVVEGEYREVEAPERLVQTFQNHLQTLEFEDLGDRTKLTQTMRFATTEERDTTKQYGVEEGAKNGLERIDALLQRLPPDA